MRKSETLETNYYTDRLLLFFVVGSTSLCNPLKEQRAGDLLEGCK